MNNIKKRSGRPKKDDPKVAISIRLDRDILDTIKQDGPNWQTRINTILRDFIINS